MNNPYVGQSAHELSAIRDVLAHLWEPCIGERAVADVAAALGAVVDDDEFFDAAAAGIHE